MFTFNRIDYTASDLNTVWDDTLKATASILPPNIRIREDGSSFDDLDFDEGTMYSRAVFRPDQVVKLVSQTALSCGFLGSWGYAGTSNGDSVLTVRDIPIITIPKDGTFDGFVAASKKRLLEEANGNIENYNTLYGAFLNSSFYQMQNNLKNDKDRRFTFSRKPSMGFTKAASASGSTFLVEAKFILTGLTYSVSLSSLTYTGYKYTTGSRIGWRPSNSTSKETFGEQGYDAWALGVATTVTMETDWLGTGYNQWFLGTNYAIGNAEKFGNSDWGQGTTPTSSSANKTTDLTSQINGTASVFTMPEEYVSGSLRIYYNGVRQIVGVTATETSSTTFSLSFVPLPGDVLNVDYRSSTSCS